LDEDQDLMLLRFALAVADRLAAALPPRFAYAVADLGGETWHRFAPGRRRLVASNLARVCEATGRPARGPAFASLVRSAFRHHARYYLEMLRTPHYATDQADVIVNVPNWSALDAAFRSGPAIMVSSHLGNFEPFGIVLDRHDLRPLAPVERIEPPELFEFLAARRGGGSHELVPLERALRPVVARLRAGGLVAIIGDRDLAGDGQRVTIFDHETTIPTGPASLAVAHRAALVVGRCLRTGPDRFRVDAEVIEVPATGNRRADIAALTTMIAKRFEHDIAAAPEQWWGAFQPFWPDLGSDPARHR
jgi:KDO2-lipid IV(A) lauroyltransferase